MASCGDTKFEVSWQSRRRRDWPDHRGTKRWHRSSNIPEGDMHGRITDMGKTQSDANGRRYQTCEVMDYYCDQCDIVGLLDCWIVGLLDCWVASSE